MSPRVQSRGIVLAALLVVFLPLGAVTAPAGAPERPPETSTREDQPMQQPPVSVADASAARARELRGKGLVFEAIDAFDLAVKADPSRAELRIEYADLLRTAGFWLRSAEQYKAAQDMRPDSVECRLGYGELLLAEYQLAAAARQFSSVLKLSPSDLDWEHAMVGLGTAQFALEDYASAARTFSEVLERKPDSAIAIAHLALSKRKLGDLDESLRLWGEFLEIQPAASRAKIHRIEIEELRAAIDQARQSVQTEPSNAAAWANLGRLLRRKPDLAGAAEAYRAAVRIQPAVASHRFSLAAVQRDRGRWADAAAEFSSVGRDSPYGPLALYNMAFCARRAGDREAERGAWLAAVSLNGRDMYAYRRYIEALEASGGLELERNRVSVAVRQAAASPRSADTLPYVRLAILRAAAGEKDASRQAALQALGVDLNDVQAQRVLRDLLLLDDEAVRRALADLSSSGAPSVSRAALLMALGREKEAEAEIRRLRVGSPNDVRLEVALAYCVRSNGRLAEAVDLLRAARDADPTYLYSHLDLGLALLDANRYDEAVAAAREAVRLAPSQPIGYALLGSALKEQGELEKAAKSLEMSVGIDPIDEEGVSRLKLARLYGAMGRNEDAREILRGDVPQEPQEIYRLAWRFVRDTYLDRTYRGQDWRRWEHRFDGKLHTTPEALGAVALMLSSLDDRNTRLRSADQTANLLFTQRTDAPEFSRIGTALSTSRTVETRRLDDNVGYIAITNLDDPKVPAEIQKAVESVKSSDGVILDLRGNQGGGDADVPRIAGLFVQPGTETGTVVKPGGTTKSKAEPAPAKGAPALPQNKPVVVLVDRHTASSAENLAGSLKESHRAVLVGEKTYGKSGIQIPKLLPGGAIVLAVGAEHADLKGKIYTGVGIKPDVTIEGANTGDRTAEDPAVRKAREILKESGSPR